MAKWKHITMFDRPYPAEKQAEGIAISQAIVGGHCIQCGFYKKCTTDNRFKFHIFQFLYYLLAQHKFQPSTKILYRHHRIPSK